MTRRHLIHNPLYRAYADAVFLRKLGRGPVEYKPVQLVYSGGRRNGRLTVRQLIIDVLAARHKDIKRANKAKKAKRQRTGRRS